MGESRAGLLKTNVSISPYFKNSVPVSLDVFQELGTEECMGKYNATPCFLRVVGTYLLCLSPTGRPMTG